MPLTTHLYQTLVLMLILTCQHSQAQPAIKIVQKISGDQHLLVGQVEKLDRPANYQLRLVKNGPNGRMQLSQQGTLKPQKNKQDTARLQLNLEAGAHYSATLQLLRGKELLCETRLEH